MAILLFLCVILSCTSSVESKAKKKELYSLSYFQPAVGELSDDQQSAFSALNKLQVSTDEKNRLYSTFSNIEHACYPADTSFIISREEWLPIMQSFIAEHCKSMDAATQAQLANASVLAQEEYTVLQCFDNNTSTEYDPALNMKGRWIFPSVLGRRDIIIVW